MKLYISPGALLLLALVYLPLVIWLLRKRWKALSWRLPLKILATAAAFIFAAAIPLLDVASTSVEMARLCPQAGLFIKKTVNVDGFYTDFGSPDMLKPGFTYIEKRSYGDRLVVYSKEGDAVKTEEFDATKYQVRSRYEFIHDAQSGAYEGRRDIGIQKTVVRDRETGEELGYALVYAAFPGWVDRNTLALLGRIGWTCDVHPDQNIMLLRKVLLPK